jgi:hypothetical protein
MANWRYRIKLGSVLEKCNEKFDLSRHEEDCPEEVRELIATEVSKAMPLHRFSRRVRAVKSIAELNRLLALIYDEADRSLVWCSAED